MQELIHPGLFLHALTKRAAHVANLTFRHPSLL